MDQAKIDALIEDFRVSVCDRAQVVDPDEALFWYDMSMGWAIGKGADVDTEREFAQQVRYKHHYYIR